MIASIIFSIVAMLAVFVIFPAYGIYKIAMLWNEDDWARKKFLAEKRLRSTPPPIPKRPFHGVKVRRVLPPPIPQEARR